jgi:hypothetical protein
VFEALSSDVAVPVWAQVTGVAGAAGAGLSGTKIRPVGLVKPMAIGVMKPVFRSTVPTAPPTPESSGSQRDRRVGSAERGAASR